MGIVSLVGIEQATTKNILNKDKKSIIKQDLAETKQIQWIGSYESSGAAALVTTWICIPLYVVHIQV